MSYPVISLSIAIVIFFTLRWLPWEKARAASRRTRAQAVPQPLANPLAWEDEWFDEKIKEIIAPDPTHRMIEWVSQGLDETGGSRYDESGNPLL
jgi:hypothetical protein